MTDTDSKYSPAGASEMRDRMLGLLLEPALPGGRPHAVPLRVEPGLAVLWLSATAGPLLVLSIEQESPAALEALQRHLRHVVQAHKSGTLGILVVGGERETRRRIKSVAPFWQISRRFSFYQLDQTGTLQRVSGAQLAVFRGVRRPLDPRPDRPAPAPMRPERLAELKDRWAGEREQELRFAAAVGSSTPRATYALVAANAVLFALELYWGGGEPGLALRRMGANNGEWVREGELWRLLASAFLHGSFAHLTVNMVALLSFGAFLEGLLGRRRFLVLYGLSALGGALASAFLQQTVSVGASGAIWGLMLAGIGLVLRPRGLVPPLTLQRMKSQATGPLLINTLYSFVPGVDLYAHFGGGLSGLALISSGLLTTGRRSSITPPPDTAQAEAPRPAGPASALLGGAALVLVLAMALSVAAGIGLGRPWELLSPPASVRIGLPETGLSLEAPAGLALQVPPRAETQDFRVLGLGSLARDPLEIDLVVVLLEQAPSPEEALAMLEDLRRDLEGLRDPTAQLEKPLQFLEIDGRKVLVFVERFPNGLRRSWWATLAGARQVLLRVDLRPDAPAAWSRLVEPIFRSLRVDSSPPSAQD